MRSLMLGKEKDWIHWSLVYQVEKWEKMYWSQFYQTDGNTVCF